MPKTPRAKAAREVPAAVAWVRLYDGRRSATLPTPNNARAAMAIVVGSNAFAVEALSRAALLAHRQACDMPEPVPRSLTSASE
jgi:hypothetical protein